MTHQSQYQEGEYLLVRLTTKLKQLRAEKEDTVQTLDKIDTSLLQGSIQEATFNALKQKYDSRLIQVEQEIFETTAEIETRKRARAKKRAKRERLEKAKPAEPPKPSVTLDKLQFRREYIRKTVNVLEDNAPTDLESVILELLTETSQMSKKLTAREIITEVRLNTQDHIAKDEVIDCLLDLYNEGKIKRIEDPKKDLRYFMDVSWNVDSLLTIQR
jgi:hypothetical protein